MTSRQTLGPEEEAIMKKQQAQDQRLHSSSIDVRNDRLKNGHHGVTSSSSSSSGGGDGGGRHEEERKEEGGMAKPEVELASGASP